MNNSPRRADVSRSQWAVGVLLLVVMLAGGYFRFVGLNWDDFTHLHPDERFLTSVASALNSGEVRPSLPTAEEREAVLSRCLERYPDPDGEGPLRGGAGGYFDAECSTLNPHNSNTNTGLYVYGTLPLFIARWTGELVVAATGDSIWTSYEGIHLVWRVLSALAEIGVILTTFAIGVRLHNKWIGLLAAALYSASVFSIQQAHFGTVDAMSNLFTALAILFAVRVQQEGKLGDYLGFGLAFAAALASRINMAPLVGLILLAAAVRLIPVFDRGLAWNERERLLTQQSIGLIAAGIVTLVGFRFFQPYAFMGPGILGLTPNPRWLEDLGTASRLVSGEVEMPPNWQWVGRTGYLFPWTNIVVWGMGVALGLAGWLSWLWAGYRLVRARTSAMRNLLPFAWVLVYFGWLGNNWVMTMRYYLPLYPALALLAAWGLAELARRASLPGAAPWRRLLAGGLVAGVTAFTFLWAAMFTNIYRHQLTSVQAGHWVWEHVPGDFAMQIEGAPPETPLINIAIPNVGYSDDLLLQASRHSDRQPYFATFVAPVSGSISTVHSPHLGDPSDDADEESIRVSVATADGATVLGQGTLTQNLAESEHVLGNSYDIPLETAATVEEGQSYRFAFEVLSGGPVVTAGGVFAWEGDWDEPAPAKVCQLPPGISLADDPPPGLLGAHECNGRDVWWGLINGYKLQVFYEEDEAKRERFVTVLDNVDYLIIGSNRRYDSQSRIPIRWPMTQRYYDALFSGELGFELAATFQETYELGPLRVSDQYLPTYSDPQWLNEFEAEEAFHVYDHPVLFIFRKSDAYDSQRMRQILYSVPLNQTSIMTGSTSDPTLVGVVPLYSLPADPAPTQLQLPPELRELQYDNGTWTRRFDSDSAVNTQGLLTVVIWWLAVVLFGWLAWPLLFALFPALADRGFGFAKFSGMLLTGWLAWYAASARVPLWTQSGVAIALVLVAGLSAWLAWRSREAFVTYLRDYWRRLLWIEVLTLLAFVVFLVVRLSNPDLWVPGFGGEKPMDFAYFNGVLRSTVFPPLDPWYAGGYINYYYFGYVIVGTPVLLLGIVPAIGYNLIIPTWFALTGIAAFSVAFNVVSALHERRKRGQDGTEISRRANPWVAGIAAMMLAVLLGNLDIPRLLIGEGLLKLGGYQQTGLVEQYLAQEYLQENGVFPQGEELTRLQGQARAESESLISSLLRGLQLARSGQPLPFATHRWYWAPTRVLGETPGVEGNAITEIPFFTYLYGDLHAHMIAMPMLLLITAFLFNEIMLAGDERRRRLERGLALGFGALNVGMLRGTNTWDWPSFLLLSIVGLTFAWWLRWRSVPRSRDIEQPEHGSRAMLYFNRLLAVLGVLLGLAVAELAMHLVSQAIAARTPPPAEGVLRAVGVLRWILRGAALVLLWRSARWVPVTRRSLVDWVVQVGGFVALHFLLSLPYISWYAATYNSIGPWEGGKTPLWAYVDLHGVFLFLIFCLLVWETGRWLRSVYVRSLRGTATILAFGLAVALVVLAAVLVLAAANYQAALVAIPLLIWIAVLFLRPGQSRPMQFVLALAGMGLGLTLGVEFIVVGGDIGRQNTVFKFYMQAWLLFSVVGGAAFAWLLQSSLRWSTALRSAWFILVTLLATVAALYPVMASRARALDRMAADKTPPTLDGMAYMQYAEYGENGVWFGLDDDYHVIRWLQENVQGTPVIMEGRSLHEYLWGSRISIYTGLPSVLGWRWHQIQQRTFDPMPRLVAQREANVNAFYNTFDIETAWNILRFYDVSYVIVSDLEKAYYPPEGLAKFERMVAQGTLEVVYEHGDATIYRVNREAF